MKAAHSLHFPFSYTPSRCHHARLPPRGGMRRAGRRDMPRRHHGDFERSFAARHFRQLPRGIAALHAPRRARPTPPLCVTFVTFAWSRAVRGLRIAAGGCMGRQSCHETVTIVNARSAPRLWGIAHSPDRRLALPQRRAAASMRRSSILLVTSRETKRWVIPKGNFANSVVAARRRRAGSRGGSRRARRGLPDAAGHAIATASARAAAPR